MDKTKLKLFFANSADEAPRMSRRIEFFLHDNGIKQDIINKILLCVDELITNIIAHAYDDDLEHAVLLECDVHEDYIELELRDDGTAFDPTHQDRPNINLGIDERGIGGLGIHLVMNLMDKVEYQRDGDYNVLKAVKLLTD